MPEPNHDGKRSRRSLLKRAGVAVAGGGALLSASASPASAGHSDCVYTNSQAYVHQDCATCSCSYVIPGGVYGQAYWHSSCSTTVGSMVWVSWYSSSYSDGYVYTDELNYC